MKRIHPQRTPNFKRNLTKQKKITRIKTKNCREYKTKYKSARKVQTQTTKRFNQPWMLIVDLHMTVGDKKIMAFFSCVPVCPNMLRAGWWMGKSVIPLLQFFAWHVATVVWLLHQSEDVCPPAFDEFPFTILVRFELSESDTPKLPTP